MNQICEVKICCKCKDLKSYEDFHKQSNHKDGLASYCKVCAKIRTAQYYIENKEKFKNHSKVYRKNNKEYFKEYKKNYVLKNKEKIKQKNKEYIERNIERYREKWREYGKKYRAKSRERDRKYYKNPKYRLNDNMSKSIRQSLFKYNGKNGAPWESLVGYSKKDLERHIEKQFKQGMTWDNYGKFGWHIDHIIPKSVFNFTSPEHDDFKKCWALKNLRPLWYKENLIKKNKLEKPFQPSLAL